MQGIAALENKNYDEAIRIFGNLIKVKPNFAQGYNFLGLAYKEKGEDIYKVISYFEKAIGFDPNNASAYENLGKIYYGLGNLDKALPYAKKAVDLDGDLLTARMSLGWIYLLGATQPKSAIIQFKKVVDKQPIAYACLGLGIAYFQDHQFPLVLEMITYLRKAGEEKYAKHLENMVRENRYIPPTVEGMSLNIAERRENTIVPNVSEENNKLSYSADNTDIANMPVYLKKKSSVSLESSSEEVIPANNSGKSRIEQLQQNSLSQPSPNSY